MTNTLKEAKRLFDLGFAILWLHPKSKRPIENGWTSGKRQSWDELCARYKPGFNVGVRTGTPSKIGKYYLACIDVDVKDAAFRNEAESALQKLIGTLILPKVISGSGNGSSHYYCVTEAPFKMLTIEKHKEWEICVYSDGRQMVLPPSIHPNGKSYKWENETPNNSVPVMSFDGIELVKKEKVSEHEIEDDIGLDSDIDVRWLPGISEKVRALIVRGIWKGKTIEDRSAYLLLAAHHLIRAKLTQNEVLAILTDPSTFLGMTAFDHAKTGSRKAAAMWVWRYTVKRAFDEYKSEITFKNAHEYEENVELKDEDAKKQAIEIISDRPWQQDIKRAKGADGEEGKIIDTLNNLDLILSHVTKTPLFQRNEFTNREVYAADAPWGMKKGSDISDIDVILIRSWLAKSEYRYEPKVQNVEQAMSLLAFRNRTHPVRDWLNSLKWDGVPRIDTWIREYLNGEAAEPYLSAISRKFLVAMVARIFRPGCQWDYTLILEGRQGTRKSTAARILASDKWFCDHLPDLKDKDAMLNLQGSWLVELGELKNIKHSDAATVKSYLTRRIDRVRAPYGHRWTDAPRQSVFIGTVNENEYFKDPTGNRRFWPVKVEDCDVERLARDRDQLFAEAKHVFDQDEEALYLEGASLIQALEAQDDRRVDDDESEMRGALLEYMKIKREERNINLGRFKMKELFEAPGAPWAKWAHSPYAYQNGAQVLNNLDFNRRKVEGQRIWGHKRPGTPRGITNASQDFY